MGKVFHVHGRTLLLGLVFLSPALLYLIPLEWVVRQPTVCVYKNILGFECFGCGMTRSVLSGLHFKFRDAFGYNKLVVVVLPLLIYLWARLCVHLWSVKKNGARESLVSQTEAEQTRSQLPR